jgi:hypothetical protein
MIRYSEHLVQKLDFWGYRFNESQNSAGESVLKVYLPILCYLKITIAENKIKITSRTFIGVDFISLEWNFLIYSLILALLLAFGAFAAHSVFTVFFLLFLFFFSMGIIKLEFLKMQIYRWADDLKDQTTPS